MNFYLRYPGDYQRDTAHLSILEHGVFGLMLDQYYGSEKPLPKGKLLYRLLRVETAAEKKAVASVVSQFWVETPEGLINKRAHAEIEKAHHKAELARKNGKKGGRPKNPDDPNTPPEGPDSDKPSENPGVNFSFPKTEPRKKVYQKPLTSNQIPDKNPMPVPEVNCGGELYDFTTGEVLRWGSEQ